MAAAPLEFICMTPPATPSKLQDFQLCPTPPGSASRRSSSTTSLLPGAIRKTGTRQRSSSVAAKVLGKSAPAPVSSLPVLKVMVTAANAFDASVNVSLEGARPDGRGLPVCRGGSSVTCSYLGSLLQGQGTRGAKGAVEVEGFSEPVPFFLAARPNGSSSWLHSKGRWKFTALHAASWDWKEHGEKPTEGKAADMELSGSQLTVSVRTMTQMELKRTLQLQALKEAGEGKDYDTLRAQVTKARMASVELEHIAKGEARLKELMEAGLHVAEGCSHDSVRDTMSWERVTNKAGTPNVDEPCTVNEDCPCNVDLHAGEVLELKENHVQDCLQEFGADADKQLFNHLVEAALAVEEGCIWKAGGKYIFSEFSRNQSYTALARMLQKAGQGIATKMLKKLVDYTEMRYMGYVTAIQVNFHPHKGTYHDQHRDIYSQKQSAGPNCTCQFQDCVGTVCYSLGSSRLALLTTMTDDMSAIKPCCDKCEGRQEYRWLHSGNSMYFNGDWNNNHTHGIPPSEEECGPRISLAFLIAAKPPFAINVSR